MPKLFDAAIPLLWQPSIHHVRPTGDLHDRDQLSWFFTGAGSWIAGRYLDPLRDDPRFSRWIPYLPEAASFLSVIEDLASLACAAESQCGDDALAVDDYFLFVLSDPEVKWRLEKYAMKRMMARLKEAGKFADDVKDTARVKAIPTMNALYDEVVLWAEESAAAGSTGNILKALFGLSPEGLDSTGLGLPCTHPGAHKRLSKRGQRGPKRRVNRRVSTWGVYLLAWIVGTEALAVRLWNKLLLPIGYRWPSLGKYWAAKQRLVRDLIAWDMMPRRRDEVRPAPPLSPLVEDILEWAVDARTRSILNHLFYRLSTAPGQSTKE